MRHNAHALLSRVARHAMLQCLLAAILCTRSVAEDSRFVPLAFSGAVAISDDGRVVTGDSNWIPYIWTEVGGQETIPLPAGHDLFDVTAISGDGSTVVGGVRVGEIFNKHYESFRWSKDEGLQLLGRLPGDMYQWAFATAASFDGSVILGTDNTYNGRRAYRWTESTGQVDLGTLGTLNPGYPPFSEGEGLSSDGNVAVGFVSTTDDEGYKAFRWTPTEGLRVIGLPGWPSSPNPWGGAYDVSGDGQVIHGRDQKTGAWTWTEAGGFELLPNLGGNTDVFVRALSHDGSTLVGNHFFWDTTPPFNNVTEAAIWRKTAAGYETYRVADLLRHQKVDLQGWWLTDVHDVSADGRTLIGTGISPEGVERSWYAVLNVVPVPEPTATVIGMGGLFAGIGVARREMKSRRLRRPQVG